MLAIYLNDHANGEKKRKCVAGKRKDMSQTKQEPTQRASDQDDQMGPSLILDQRRRHLP